MPARGIEVSEKGGSRRMAENRNFKQGINQGGGTGYEKKSIKN
jgi:hypothetical protein